MKVDVFLMLYILTLLAVCQKMVSGASAVGASTGCDSEEIQRPQLMYNDKMHCYSASGFEEE